MTKKQIATELKRLRTAIFKAKQFNKKIEANSNYQSFRKSNNITIENISNVIYNFYFAGTLIYKESPKYSTRKINLEYKEIGINQKILV